MTNTILHKTIDSPMAECEEVLRVAHDADGFSTMNHETHVIHCAQRWFAA